MPGRPARMRWINSQKVAGEGIDAGGRLVEDQEVGVVDSAQHRQSFCFMPPESLPAGRSGNRPSPVLSSSRRCGGCSRCGQAEQPGEEVDVFEDGEGR